MLQRNPLRSSAPCQVVSGYHVTPSLGYSCYNVIPYVPMRHVNYSRLPRHVTSRLLILKCKPLRSSVACQVVTGYMRPHQ